jgi:hypothetical protein
MADKLPFKGPVELQGATTISGATTSSGGLTITGALQYPSVAAGDARELLASENGATVFWTKDSGHHITLPPAAAGLYYRIVVLVGSDNNHHILPAAGDYFYGKVTVVGSGADNDVAVQTVLKGATAGNHDHMKIDQNATDTGGEVGSVINLWAVDDTGWLVEAHLSTTGTPGSIATIYAG